jgi:hypothetical protein
MTLQLLHYNSIKSSIKVFNNLKLQPLLNFADSYTTTK